MQIWKKGATVVAAIVSVVGTTSASVIYSENFSGTAGSALGGSAPTLSTGLDGGTLAATWNAATSSSTVATTTVATGHWKYSGSGTASITGTDLNPNNFSAGGLIAGAYLPFSPQAGLVYTLSITLAPTIGNGTSQNWLGLGFFQPSLAGHSVSGTASLLSNNFPYGLIVDKPTGEYQTFAGLATSNPGPSGTIAQVPHAVSIQLDTTGAAYTFAWSIDGGAFSTPQTATGTPTIGWVGFGTNKQAGSVSNFSLTSTPEPASLVTLVGGATLLCVRRRRSENRVSE